MITQHSILMPTTTVKGRLRKSSRRSIYTRIESHQHARAVMIEVIHIEDILINKAIYFNFENMKALCDTVYIIMLKSPNFDFAVRLAVVFDVDENIVHRSRLAISWRYGLSDVTRVIDTSKGSTDSRAASTSTRFLTEVISTDGIPMSSSSHPWIPRSQGRVTMTVRNRFGDCSTTRLLVASAVPSTVDRTFTFSRSPSSSRISWAVVSNKA
jgi:hypothetical protein